MTVQPPMSMPRPVQDGEPCAEPSCRLFIRKQDEGWVHIEGSSADVTPHRARPEVKVVIL